MSVCVCACLCVYECISPLLQVLVGQWDSNGEAQVKVYANEWVVLVVQYKCIHTGKVQVVREEVVQVAVLSA